MKFMRLFTVVIVPFCGDKEKQNSVGLEDIKTVCESILGESLRDMSCKTEFDAREEFETENLEEAEELSYQRIKEIEDNLRGALNKTFGHSLWAVHVSWFGLFELKRGFMWEQKFGKLL